MARVHYEEKRCSAALHRVQGMSFKWSLNPYQGCVHGCHYCYARRYHGYLELDAGQDFPTVIFVKTNVVERLRQEMRRPGWVGENVMLGTATDPYQPIEGRYHLTRGCLQACLDHGTPVSLVTKGTLIVRDLDVLRQMAAARAVSVCFSLTTLDRRLWRELEPGTPPPEQRLLAMARLSQAGVRAGVLLAPVIPGLTDDRRGLEAVVEAAADHGAQFLGTQTLYLKPGTREHFMDFLKSEHPELLAAYHRLYPGDYAPKRFQQGLGSMVSELKRTHALRDRPGNAHPTYQQLTLEV
jgi:DNA repair photolyase